MARRPRVHFPGALYHVISRGNQRQKIYKDDPDYQRFETLLGEVIKRHALTLYAYVLMPNHFLCGAQHNLLCAADGYVESLR